MVFRDQCKLPARSPGSSRQAPLPGNMVTDFTSGKKEETLNSMDICSCLMDFPPHTFRMVVSGKLGVLRNG